LSDSWTLKDSPEGKVLVLRPGGKELKLSEGGPIRIEIKGDKLEMISEPDKIGKKIIVTGNPEVDVVKLREDAAKKILRKSIEIDVRDTEKLQDVIRKKIAVEIDAAKIKELAETQEEIGAALAEKKAKIAVEIDANKLKELAEKKAVIVAESGKLRDEIKKATALALAQVKEAKGRAVIVREDASAVREQAKKIREMLTEVKEKKRDFADLETAVEKLEAGLAALEAKPAREFRVVRPGVAWSITEPDVKTGVRTIVKPEIVTVIKEGEAGETKTIVMPRAEAGARAGAITIKTVDEGGAVTVVAVSGKGKSRADYDKAVAQLKKDLPEGAVLEPEFDEASGIITLKVKSSGKTGISEDIVKKIAGVLKDETKK
jgi:hypothetical protein